MKTFLEFKSQLEEGFFKGKVYKAKPNETKAQFKHRLETESKFSTSEIKTMFAKAGAKWNSMEVKEGTPFHKIIDSLKTLASLPLASDRTSGMNRNRIDYDSSEKKQGTGKTFKAREGESKEQFKLRIKKDSSFTPSEVDDIFKKHGGNWETMQIKDPKNRS